MNNVKFFREQKRLTQSELAEKSGISLRTIQRIESGGPLKGFSLNAIAKGGSEIIVERFDIFIRFCFFV